MFSIFVHNFSCSAIYSAQIVSFWCNKIENFIAGGIIDGEGTKGFREEDVGAGARETIGAGAGAAPARWAPMPCTPYSSQCSSLRLLPVKDAFCQPKTRETGLPGGRGTDTPSGYRDRAQNPQPRETQGKRRAILVTYKYIRRYRNCQNPEGSAMFYGRAMCSRGRENGRPSTSFLFAPKPTLTAKSKENPRLADPVNPALFSSSFETIRRRQWRLPPPPFLGKRFLINILHKEFFSSLNRIPPKYDAFRFTATASGCFAILLRTWIHFLCIVPKGLTDPSRRSLFPAAFPCPACYFHPPKFEQWSDPFHFVLIYNAICNCNGTFPGIWAIAISQLFMAHDSCRIVHRFSFSFCSF